MTDFIRVFPVAHPDAQPSEVHLLQAPAALAMLTDQTEVPFSSVAFRKEAILMLLSQSGAEGLKFFHGHNGHHTTLVGFAVDANGTLMASAGQIALENGERCPPFC